MNNIEKTAKDEVIDEESFKEIGTLHISMYEHLKSKLPIFILNADNENVLQLSYVIEDCLEDY